MRPTRQKSRPSLACKKLREKFNITRTDVYVDIARLAESVTTAVPLHFLHVPKTGGSTITLMVNQPHKSDKYRFMPHGDCTSKKFNEYCAQNVGCRCSLWHTPPRYLSPILTQDKPVFCIVRHPVARALSQYKMECRNLHNPPPPDVYFPAMLRAAATKGPHYSDCHMLSQYEYLWTAESDGRSPRRTCDYVLRYEDGDVVEQVQALLNGSGTVAANPTPAAVTHHSASAFSKWRLESLPPTAVKLVAGYYWKDMCLLGYDLTAEPPGPRELQYSNPYDNCGPAVDINHTAGVVASPTPVSVTVSVPVPQKQVASLHRGLFDNIATGGSNNRVAAPVQYVDSLVLLFLLLLALVLSIIFYLVRKRDKHRQGTLTLSVT